MTAACSKLNREGRQACDGFAPCHMAAQRKEAANPSRQPTMTKRCPYCSCCNAHAAEFVEDDDGAFMADADDTVFGGAPGEEGEGEEDGAGGSRKRKDGKGKGD